MEGGQELGEDSRKAQTQQGQIPTMESLSALWALLPLAWGWVCLDSALGSPSEPQALGSLCNHSLQSQWCLGSLWSDRYTLEYLTPAETSPTCLVRTVAVKIDPHPSAQPTGAQMCPRVGTQTDVSQGLPASLLLLLHIQLQADAPALLLVPIRPLCMTFFWIA